jgi:hypothetical protein
MDLPSRVMVYHPPPQPSSSTFDDAAGRRGTSIDVQRFESDIDVLTPEALWVPSTPAEIGDSSTSLLEKDGTDDDGDGGEIGAMPTCA